MKSPWLKILPLLVAAILLGGCATKVPALASITMRLVAIKTGPSGPVASVEYLNESVLSIGLAATRHRIYVGGTMIGEARHTDAIGLASNLPVVVDIPLERKGGEALPTGGQLNYRMENRLTVLVGDQRVNYDAAPSNGIAPVR